MPRNLLQPLTTVQRCQGVRMQRVSRKRGSAFVLVARFHMVLELRSYEDRSWTDPKVDVASTAGTPDVAD